MSGIKGCLVIFLSFFICNVEAQIGSKKLPSVSYGQIINCYPELKSSDLESNLSLSTLKKIIDRHYGNLKSIMKYRRVIFTDFKTQGEDIHSDNTAISKTSIKKRLTMNLVQIKKGQPEYKMTLEQLVDNVTGDVITLPRAHQNNPSSEIIKSYLINGKIEEDLTHWLDTKLNKLELSYKISNESLMELNLAQISPKKELKCEVKTDRAVLCLCLK